MRDFELPGRSTAYGRHGMAATSHPVATLAALDVLRADRNGLHSRKLRSFDEPPFR